MKKHPIPILDEEKWKDLQYHLGCLSELVNKLESLTIQDEIKKLAEALSIHLGLINVILGRTYTLDELLLDMRELKKQIKKELYNEKENK